MPYFTSPTTRMRRAIQIAVAISVVAIACSGCATGSSSGGGSSTIKVGIPVADTASLAQAGVAAKDALSVADIETMYKSALNVVSGKSAAGGHKLVPDFSSFSLVDPGAPQTACLHFVRDSKDDVVLSNQFVNGGDQCVVQRGGFLLQNVAAPQTAYNSKVGHVVTTDLTPDAAAKNFAAYLTGDAKLTGQKLGVLTDALGGDAAPVTGILIPALKKAGLNVVHVTTLTADLTQVAQQVPVEVTQMKEAGVTTIIDATPSANLMDFLGGASKAGYDVPYIASDLNNAVDETFSPAYPPNLQATAITARRFAEPDSALAATCYANYQKAGGKTLVAGSVNYQELLEICDSVTLLAAGVSHLGSTGFSSSAFVTALGKVGTLHFAYYGPSGLSGTSQSTVQGVRTVTWSKGSWASTGSAWTAPANG